MEPKESELSCYHHYQRKSHPPPATVSPPPSNGILPNSPPIVCPHSVQPVAGSSPSRAGRKKRGRPRKYSTPEQAAAAKKIASLSVKKDPSLMRRGNGASSSSNKKLQLAVLGNAGQSFIPRITAVTAGENDVTSEAVPAPKMAQNVVLEKTSTNLYNVHVHTVDKRVQEEHVVDNDAEEAKWVIQVESPIAGAGNDQAYSSRGNSDYGLWQGHEVNSEFVGLLDLIMIKHPETFEHFTSKSKVCTMKLNMLCSSVNAFIKTSLADVTSEMIMEYRDLVADFQRWGFNVNWLTSRLNYIEQIQFSRKELHRIDSLIDDAKSKLQELQALRCKKMTDIEEAFGNMSSLLSASAGEGLFSGP